MTESNQRCIDAIARAHTETKEKIGSLTKKMEVQQMMLQHYGMVGVILFVLMFIVTIVVLIKSLGAF